MASNLLEQILQNGLQGLPLTPSLKRKAKPYIHQGLVAKTTYKTLVLTLEGYKELGLEPWSPTLEWFVSRVRNVLGEEYIGQLQDHLPTSGPSHRTSMPTCPNLMVKWEVGGTSGGSCWNDSEPKLYILNALPQRLTSLEYLLEQVAPTIHFLAYNRLVDTLVEQKMYDVSEHYGNRVTYIARYIRLDLLMDFLQENRIPVSFCGDSSLA